MLDGIAHVCWLLGIASALGCSDVHDSQHNASSRDDVREDGGGERGKRSGDVLPEPDAGEDPPLDARSDAGSVPALRGGAMSVADAGTEAPSEDDAGSEPAAVEPAITTCMATTAAGVMLSYELQMLPGQRWIAHCGARWQDGDVIRSWRARIVHDGDPGHVECRVAEDARDDIARFNYALQPWTFELVDGAAIASGPDGSVELACN